MQTTRSRLPVHRAPRKWPFIPAEPIAVQMMPTPTRPSGASLLVTIASLAGLVLSVVIYSQLGAGQSPALILGLLAVSGLSMVASLVTFVIQRQSSNADAGALATNYKQYLDDIEQSLRALSEQEVAARRLKDQAIPDLAGSLGRHPERVWQRRPEDPDFLHVRLGRGDMPAWTMVALTGQGSAFSPPAKDIATDKLQKRAQRLVAHYQSARDVPVTIPLDQHAAVAVLNGAPSAASGQALTAASAATRALVSNLVVHHAPQDVHLMVFAPMRQASDWAWIPGLPSAGAKWQGLGYQAGERATMLSALLSELNRRAQARDNRRHEPTTPRVGPHLIIVVDSFAGSGETDPLTTPAIALALRQGKDLGATVVSLHALAQQAPAEVTLALDVPSSRIAHFGPSPAPDIALAAIDRLETAQCVALQETLRQFEYEEEAALGLPSQAPLLRLFTPAIGRPDAYPITQTWQDARTRIAQAGGKAEFVIPIGRKIGQEPVYLDLVNDGPHGLLIGQTGSGKSELLRSIIAALAIQYPPDLVNFALVDYKGGLAFDAFENLPHTVAYLTNMVYAGQTSRFLAMLEAEIVRRQLARNQNTALPELFVIIDEFAEMVSRRSSSDTNEIILENLLSIARLGRELGVHLLFASQRPEGSIIQRLRGYVQYRICLRTNSEEDSREIIGRPDAAQLPYEIPGRGYLLRGDNELLAFQAARIAMPFFSSERIGISQGGKDSTLGRKTKTADKIIASRMADEIGNQGITRWPGPLPMPSIQQPTPLVLYADGSEAGVKEAWTRGQRRTLRALETPVGLFDCPGKQQQDWFIADFIGHEGRMMGGPLLIMGDLNAGKSTTLQTLLLSLALTQSPSALRWFVLDPSGAFGEFSLLPHVRDLVEPRQSNLIEGYDEDGFRAFTTRFERAVQSEPTARPAILLVVDDYDELGAQHQRALHNVTQKAMRSRDRQVYVALTAARISFDGLPQTIINGASNRIILSMNDQDQMRGLINGRLPPLPEAAPGRGFIQRRRSLDEIQIAAPTAGNTDAERSERLEAVIRACVAHWK